MGRTILSDIAKILREYEPSEGVRVGILKIQTAEHRVVSGWGYVSRDPANKLAPPSHTDGSGNVADWSEETVNVYEMEKAVWAYVEDYREADEMHEGPPVATLVGALTFTPEIKSTIIPGGMDPDFPEGTFLQYRVHDDEVWAKIKSGEYKMLSLYGLAEHHEVSNA